MTVAAYALCVLNTYPFGFLSVREIGVVHYSQQDHRRILNPGVRYRLRIYAGSEEKAQSRDSADLLPVEVVYLDDGFAVAECYNLSNIGVRLD